MNTEKNRTVAENMIASCAGIRRADTPLIFIDTYDIDLVNEIALQSGLVTPVRVQRYSEADRERHYFAFLSAGTASIQDYGNFYNSWAALTQRDGKAFPITRMAPGMYILALTAESWTQRSSEGSPRIVRLREYVQAYVNSIDPCSAVRQSCLLLYGDSRYLPADLMTYTAIVEEEYPQKWEIRQILKDMTGRAGVPLDEEVIQDLLKDLSGFCRNDVYRRIRELLNADWQDGQSRIYDPQFRKERILEAKKQVLLQNGGILELQKPKDTKDTLAGMGAYQTWVKSYKGHMEDPDRYELERGIPAPKGVLLCGVPGCGKSEAAKILQAEWNLPMVKMNIDQLMGGIVGESEKNLRTALRQAEAMAPCILWIDELEKGFSGASSKQSSDSGTFQRMFGRLLNWMQDNERACFIFATANDISALPPEFFRSGRFDALYGVFMPTHRECKDIFREQMRRAEQRRIDQAGDLGTEPAHPLFEVGCDSEDNLDAIMAVFTKDADLRNPDGVKFMSGADIAKIVTTTLRTIPLNGPITTGQWVTAVQETIRSDLRTQGSGFANLNSIAACYLRLLRGNFSPASDADQVLLKSSDYHVDWDPEKERITAHLAGTEPKNDYDKALYNAMVQRINRFAATLENNEAARQSQ